MKVIDARNLPKIVGSLLSRLLCRGTVKVWAYRGCISLSTSQLQSAFDFVNGAVGYRFRSGASRKDALARAAGFGKGTIPTIIDEPSFWGS